MSTQASQAPISETENISGIKRKTSWTAREEARKKQETVKTKERELLAKRNEEITKRKESIKERKQKADDKLRLEAMAAKMGRRKLQRKAKRMGLTKKVAH
ncbi:unnamed protein product [Tilletia laevis]|uniref:rRNA-processing protein n=2 Tax=Tilletia TaxID=13289 RepID=A0A177VC03_9BASI|nr:hypothetical protein CF335_g5393 [Tilletia laevis]KAE8204800.1 hypothetical protein CF328_g872 [Tilletia controversa]KAE8264940.1 hypothetical protein A4X03_0g597 [Tilletia caries]KAE8200013.1 hypothetical protein CF336_g922 [Tilletia laevis]CAD6888746.1 unnamed protein product [Tilletia caries]